MKEKLRSILLVIGIGLILSLSGGLNTWAGWEEIEVEGVSNNWQYKNDDNGELEKDKWLFDEGKWYYVKSDGVMLKNEWLLDTEGKRVAYFGADGAVCNLASPLEHGGPGVEVNKYLTDNNEGEKVKLNMDYLDGLTPEERRLFDYILDNYKMDDKTDTVFKQNLFIVLSADELGELLGLKVVEYEGKHCVFDGDVKDALNHINTAVMKETRNEFFILTESKMYGGPNRLASHTYVYLNKNTVSHILNIKTLNEYINNALVKALNIEDGKTSQIEAAKRIYEWMCDEFTYNIEMLDSDLYTCWIMREGICWSFSGLYKKMCNMCGIKCDVIGGSNYWKAGADGHCWNSITIDGIQRFVDVTWGNSVKEIGGNREAVLKYFNIDRVEDTNAHANYLFVK